VEKEHHQDHQVEDQDIHPHPLVELGVHHKSSPVTSTIRTPEDLVVIVTRTLERETMVLQSLLIMGLKVDVVKFRWVLPI
jgi:hypothetical protein